MNFTLENAAAYCVQVAVVIMAGGVVPWAFRLRAPRQLLAYRQFLLLACIALPFLQPWKAPAVIVIRDLALRGNVALQPAPAQGGPTPWTLGEAIFAVFLGGALLRFAWICAGFIRLRLYRQSARILEPLPAEIRVLRARIAPQTDLLVSRRVTGPVTFGFWNPAVLLPEAFPDFPPPVREAIVCHELLHIERRDWIVVVAEELVRCVFWFHPAVWWLLGRIQLVREQVVDLAVIERTNEPESYVDALLVIATSKLQADLAPAPLFLRKRHLRQRVATIVQGASMPKRLLFLSSIAVFAALPLVVGVTAWQFPLNAAPQEVRDGIGVEVRPGPWTMLHRTGIAYPREAREMHLSGDVIVSVSVNAKGEVTDARIVSGPDEFRRAVLESVLGWHFANSDWDLGNGVRKPAPPSFEMAIRFDASQLPPPPPPPPPASSVAGPARGTLAAVDVSSLPASMQARVRSVLPTPGASIEMNDLPAYMAKLREIDDHLRLHMSRGSDSNVKMTATLPLSSVSPGGPMFGVVGGVPSGVPGGVIGGVPGGIGGGVVGGTVRNDSPSVVAGEPRRIRVGGNIQASNLIQKVTPAYPPLAKQAKIQGVVRFEAVISVEGKITNLQLVMGHPLLVESATDAVSQWLYRPTLLNGNPVEVITQIDVNYTLSDSPQAADQDLLRDRSRKAGQ